MKTRKSKSRHSGQKHQKRKKARTLKPYTTVKQRFFQVENPFAQIPFEKRIEILKQIGERAKTEFEETYPSLKNWFAEYDALYILSFCVYYFLAAPEGIDKEAGGERPDFFHYYLELLQAFALTAERSNSSKPLQGDAAVLQESLRKAMDSYQNSAFSGISADISETELRKRQTIAEIRSQTSAVRNNAYASQVLSFYGKLLHKLSKLTEDFYGLNLNKFIEVLLMKNEIIGDDLNRHLHKTAGFYRHKTIEKVIKAFVENFNDKSGYQEMYALFVKTGGDLDAFKAMLIGYTDLRLQQFFLMSAKELAIYYGDESKEEQIEKILDALSYTFGDLAGANPQHFILDNPVLKKPFIKIGKGVYFNSLLGIFYHLIPNIIEVLVKEIGYRAAEKYQKARAELLEDETEMLFKTYFPSAKIYRGSKWTDSAIGKEYENDLLIVIDRFAFVVECKSGAVDSSARRGGEFRIIDTLKNLVVDAAAQAKRFIKHLTDNPGVHNFLTAAGRLNTVDNSKVNFYVPLSVTIETLGTISANLRQCLEAGLIKGDAESFVPSISVTDLEVIFELLENEIERIHYLVRRSQIERELSYVGDEGDLLAFYLDTGFNLGMDEEPGKIGMNLLMKSKEIDPYFTARENGVTVPKPRLALTKWWRDIIEYLIKRKPEFWSEMGYIFLNISQTEQKRFEKEFKNLKARVIRGTVEFAHNWVVLETLPNHRSYIFTGFPYLISDNETRNDIIRNQVLNRDVVTDDKLGALCIAVAANSQHYPYSVLVFVPREYIQN